MRGSRVLWVFGVSLVGLLAVACGKPGPRRISSGATLLVQAIPTLGEDSCLHGFPNNTGVGQACSAQGNQCTLSGAPFCTADFASLPDAFCTKPCGSDADCGANAQCVGDPNKVSTLSACVPKPCLESLQDVVGGILTPELPGVNDPNQMLPPGCPPEAANNAGVGLACHKGGRECSGTAAPYCSADYAGGSGNGFCTKECNGDDACGTGATCVSDPGGSGVRACVPKACQGNTPSPTPVPSGETCPPAQGNERGVGDVCSGGGGECKHQRASICTADVITGAPVAFCTMPCLLNRDCGKEATCVSGGAVAPALRVCVPTSCQP